MKTTIITILLGITLLFSNCSRISIYKPTIVESIEATKHGTIYTLRSPVSVNAITYIGKPGEFKVGDTVKLCK